VVKQVIALVAMGGAGKSFVASFFRDKYNLPVLRFGDETDRGLAKKNLPPTEENERLYREQLRGELGMAAYALKIEPRIQQALATHNTVILDGLYSWEEYLYLKVKHPQLILVAITSDRAVRYERLTKRGVRPLTKEYAYARDVAEIENLHKGGPIAIADFVIENNGTLEELEEKIKALSQRLRI
jgi:dephospho-CoA kinase